MAKRDDDDDSDLPKLRAWLAALPKQKQVEIARKAQISAPYLNQLINGTRSNPSAQVLRRLSVALGVRQDALYEDPPSAEALEAATKLLPRR